MRSFRSIAASLLIVASAVGGGSAAMAKGSKVSAPSPTPTSASTPAVDPAVPAVSGRADRTCNPLSSFGANVTYMPGNATATIEAKPTLVNCIGGGGVASIVAVVMTNVETGNNDYMSSATIDTTGSTPPFVYSGALPGATYRLDIVVTAPRSGTNVVVTGSLNVAVPAASVAATSI
jgi:hypothetical protein